MDTSTGPRLITLSCGHGFTVDICIAFEDPTCRGVAHGTLYVKGSDKFKGRGDWTATHETVGHVVRITNSSFTSTQKYALGHLITSTIGLHRIDF